MTSGRREPKEPPRPSFPHVLVHPPSPYIWCTPKSQLIFPVGEFIQIIFQKNSNISPTPAGHSHAILIEDDMLISKDFFSLFEQTAPLLDMDPTLMCVSSWNDNGFKHLNLPKDKLFRTGFFPGLGWMLKRELWENELSKVFPRDQWDHFMRVHSTSKGRECVVPYLSRNKNIGISGSTSNANFFKTYLQDVASYEGGGAIAFGDLSYLLFRNYEKGVQKLVKKATIMLSSDIYFAEEGEPDPSWMGADKVVLIPYLREQYDRLSKKMRIYHTPRSFHQYTLLLRYRGVQVILADKRLSPFLPKKKASKPISGLRVVPAPSVGKSCNDVCESLEGGWDCAKTQFDFINQCRVLQKVFKGCADGCRKEWGKDIPNREHLGAEENAFGGRQCLVTEEIPTCEARHPKTQRICPCTPRGGGEAKRSGSLEIRAATERDLSCHDVCTGLGPGYTCDETQFHYVNTCSVLKQHFPCKSCAANQGKDIPNYVVEENGMGKAFFLGEINLTNQTRILEPASHNVRRRPAQGSIRARSGYAHCCFFLSTYFR